jgi:hypothetical protein
MSDAVTGFIKVLDVAKKGGTFATQIPNALRGVTMGTYAAAQIGDVANLSKYLRNGQLAEDLLKKDNLILETVNGKQIIRTVKDITISAEIVEALYSTPIVAADTVVSADDFLQLISNNGGSPAPVSNAQIAAAEQEGDPN